MNVVVQIFAREPRPGECKRRMIPALGPERAAQLHKRMLEAALRAGQQSAAYQVELWGAGSLPHPELRQFARRYGISLFEQEGDDLGARMLAAMRHASDRGLASVLMGSDCPELSEDRLDPVIDVVSAGPLWVFVPAHDGGYACVASSQPTSVPFERMTWGTADVMTHTRRRLIAANQCWIELPNVADIDRPEDLAALPETWEFG